MPQLLTPAQAQACLIRQGKSVAAFAREHGLSRHTVYEVLSGKKKGRYGEAHRAAVLLGIKEGDFPLPSSYPLKTKTKTRTGRKELSTCTRTPSGSASTAQP